MHGLIFETSIWLLAGSTRYLYDIRGWEARTARPALPSLSSTPLVDTVSLNRTHVNRQVTPSAGCQPAIARRVTLARASQPQPSHTGPCIRPNLGRNTTDAVDKFRQLSTIMEIRVLLEPAFLVSKYVRLGLNWENIWTSSIPPTWAVRKKKHKLNLT